MDGQRSFKSIKDLKDYVAKIEEDERYVKFLKDSLNVLDNNDDYVGFEVEKRDYDEDLSKYESELNSMKENFDVEEAKKDIKLYDSYNNWVFNFNRLDTLIKRDGINTLSSQSRDRYNELYNLIQNNKAEYENILSKYGINSLNSIDNESVVNEDDNEIIVDNVEEETDNLNNSSTLNFSDDYNGRLDYLRYLVNEYENYNGDLNDQMYRDSKEFLNLLNYWNENIAVINRIVNDSKSVEDVVNPWDYEEMKEKPQISGISNSKKIDHRQISDYITAYVNLSDVLGRYNSLNGNFRNGQLIKSLESRIGVLKNNSSNIQNVVISPENSIDDSRINVNNNPTDIVDSVSDDIKIIESELNQLVERAKGNKHTTSVSDKKSNKTYIILNKDVSKFRELISKLRSLKTENVQNSGELLEDDLVNVDSSTVNDNLGIEDSLNASSLSDSVTVSDEGIRRDVPLGLPANATRINEIDSSEKTNMYDRLKAYGVKLGNRNACEYFKKKKLFLNDEMKKINGDILATSKKYKELINNMNRYNIGDYGKEKKKLEDWFKSYSDKLSGLSKLINVCSLLESYFSKLVELDERLNKALKSVKSVDDILLSNYFKSDLESLKLDNFNVLDSGLPLESYDDNSIAVEIKRVEDVAAAVPKVDIYSENIKSDELEEQVVVPELIDKEPTYDDFVPKTFVDTYAEDEHVIEQQVAEQAEQAVVQAEQTAEQAEQAVEQAEQAAEQAEQVEQTTKQKKGFKQKIFNIINKFKASKPFDIFKQLESNSSAIAQAIITNYSLNNINTHMVLPYDPIQNINSYIVKDKEKDETTYVGKGDRGDYREWSDGSWDWDKYFEEKKNEESSRTR